MSTKVKNSNSKIGGLMKYIKKICPVCGNEFVVLKDVDDKAVYCTIACLLGSQFSGYEQFSDKLESKEI